MHITDPARGLSQQEVRESWTRRGGQHLSPGKGGAFPPAAGQSGDPIIKGPAGGSGPSMCSSSSREGWFETAGIAAAAFAASLISTPSRSTAASGPSASPGQAGRASAGCGGMGFAGDCRGRAGGGGHRPPAGGEGSPPTASWWAAACPATSRPSPARAGGEKPGSPRSPDGGRPAPATSSSGGARWPRERGSCRSSVWGQDAPGQHGPVSSGGAP